MLIWHEQRCTPGTLVVMSMTSRTRARLYTAGVGSENWTKRRLEQLPPSARVRGSGTPGLIGRRWGSVYEAGTLGTATNTTRGRAGLRSALWRALDGYCSMFLSLIGSIVRTRSNPRLARPSQVALGCTMVVLLDELRRPRVAFALRASGESPGNQVDK